MTSAWNIKVDEFFVDDQLSKWVVCAYVNCVIYKDKK